MNLAYPFTIRTWLLLTFALGIGVVGLVSKVEDEGQSVVGKAPPGKAREFFDWSLELISRPWRSRTMSCGNSCLANLVQMDGAKQQWALENGKTGSDVPSVAELCEYLKGDGLPICPQGGGYTILEVEVSPRCTHPGHRVNRPPAWTRCKTKGVTQSPSSYPF